MTSLSTKSKLSSWSLIIVSAIWITNAATLLIRPLLPPSLLQLTGLLIGSFIFIAYSILFPMCVVMSLIAIVKKRGYLINNIGTLLLSLPPVIYILYFAVKFISQQGDL